MKGNLFYSDSDTDGSTTVQAEVHTEHTPMTDERFRIICKLIACGMASVATVLVVAIGGVVGTVTIGMVDFFLVLALVIEP